MSCVYTVKYISYMCYLQSYTVLSSELAATWRVRPRGQMRHAVQVFALRRADDRRWFSPPLGLSRQNKHQLGSGYTYDMSICM